MLSPDLSDVTTVNVTAYADDLTVIIRSEDDISHVFSGLDVFQSASSARVNWNKTDALLLGQWQEENIPHLP